MLAQANGRYYVYLLLRPEISQDQRVQIITNIHNETLRLNTLTSSFLDLARLESGRVQYHKTRFNINDLIYECKDVMQGKADELHILLKVTSDETLPLVEADREQGGRGEGEEQVYPVGVRMFHRRFRPRPTHHPKWICNVP